MGSATAGLRSAACPGGSLPSLASTARAHEAARLGTTWTGTRTLSGRKNPWPCRPVVTTSLPSHAVLTESGRLLHPREAGARPLTTFRTPTHQTLRPALNGRTPRAHHHARRPAKLKIFFRDTAIATPPGSRNLRTGTTNRSRLLPIRPNLNVERPDLRLATPAKRL